MGFTISTSIASTGTGGIPTVGVTDASSATAGNVGEVIQSTATSVSITTSVNFFDVTSITLTAGDWLISGHCYMTNGSGANSMSCSILTVSGNNSTGFSQGINAQIGTCTSASTVAGATVSNLHVNNSSSITYYLKTSVSFTSPTPFVSGRITAVRIR